MELLTLLTLLIIVWVQHSHTQSMKRTSEKLQRLQSLIESKPKLQEDKDPTRKTNLSSIVGLSIQNDLHRWAPRRGGTPENN